MGRLTRREFLLQAVAGAGWIEMDELRRNTARRSMEGRARASGRWTIAAGSRISRQLSIRDGRLSTESFRTGRLPPVGGIGPEFRLGIGEEVRELTSDHFKAVHSGNLRFTCIREASDPIVVVEYGHDPKFGVLHKTVTVINTSIKPVLLRWVDPEAVLPGEPVSYSASPEFSQLGDWGQPVYTSHFYLGVEFPAVRTAVRTDGSLQTREYPGIWLDPRQSWTSHRAIMGADPGGSVQAAFFEYITRLTPHWPETPRAFIYWDGFRVIKPPNRTKQGIHMVELLRKMEAMTRFHFDSWTYDAGFDMYRAEGLWVPTERNIWARTQAALHGTGTPLGFWCSFSGAFDTPTYQWGALQGYGLQNPNAYCLAEPTYFQAVKERLRQIVLRYNMNSINFDGMYWGEGYGCNTLGHGHLVGSGNEAGIYGTYAVVEREVQIFRELRRLQPDICMDLFVCNEWSSPWWLMDLDGVHTVPGDTIAAGIPSPWLRDELITARDIQVWEEHDHLHRQFPLWAEDLYGNQVRADHLIDGIQVTGEAMTRRWEDEYVMALAGRGTVSAYLVCCDLHVLDQTQSGLKFLGDVANWVKRNHRLYRHWALIGGEPTRREIYGYVHGNSRGRALVALRNPSIQSRNFSLRIGTEFNLRDGGPYQVTQVYPYRYTWPEVSEGEGISIPLPDFAVALFEVRAPSRKIENLPAGRWCSYDSRIAVAGSDVEPPVPDAQLGLVAPDRAEIQGKVHIPTGERAELQLNILLPPDTQSLNGSALIDGRPAELRLHFRNRGNTQDAWALVTLRPGEHTLTLSLDCKGSARLSGWIQYQTEPKFRLTNIGAPTGLIPLLHPAELRRTVEVLPETSITA